MSTTQSGGLEFVEDDELREKIRDLIESSDESIEQWLEDAVRFRMTIDDTLDIFEESFDDQQAKADFIRDSVLLHASDYNSLYIVSCEECDDDWVFADDDEEKAQTFFETHDLHIGHEPTEFVQIGEE
jgi:hypothetical protein